MRLKFGACLALAVLVSACAANDRAVETASAEPAAAPRAEPFASTYRPYPGVPTLVTNVSGQSDQVLARTVEAGSTTSRGRTRPWERPSPS